MRVLRPAGSLVLTFVHGLEYGLFGHLAIGVGSFARTMFRERDANYGVNGTPKNAETHAKQIRQAVKRYPHPKNSDEEV